jgi:hypothetical protein
MPPKTEEQVTEDTGVRGTPPRFLEFNVRGTVMDRISVDGIHVVFE